MQEIVRDYESLIHSKIKIPIYGGEIIEFSFKMENLPHLLGLNRLVDISIFERFSNRDDKNVNSKIIIDGIKENKINIPFIMISKYFNQIYNDKIKYFSTENILKALENPTIIKFNPNSIKDFQTKLDKLDYLFYEIVLQNNNSYYHFGIGFSIDNGGGNFPNTFFVRCNDDYIKNDSDKVYPTSFYIKYKNGNVKFKVHWNNIRRNLIFKKKSYKKLRIIINKYHIDIFGLTTDSINDLKIDNNDKEILKSDFIKLRRDEVYEAYSTQIKFDYWNNEYKDYLVNKIDLANSDLLPNQVRKLLNEKPNK